VHSLMNVNMRLILPSANSQIYGVIFDPLADESIEILDPCEENDFKLQLETDPESTTPMFYLGSCGLILDYLL
jgi:hypothetical protein